MHKLQAGIVGFITLLILTPGVVLAKNYCISGFPNASYILVGQGFKVPAKGKCKPWTGFNTQGNFPTSGNGCTSSDGTNLSLSLTTGDEPDAFVEIDTISLALPAQTGDVVGQVIESSPFTFGPDAGITGAPCPSTAVPAVAPLGAAAARAGDGSPIR
ncbi:MAG TPA: hypothetical protein VMV27_02525 [Candidatus Binataceae bacterium]|nr:hypothetical protein [Candidatus Binataceae bacterium]